MSTNKKLIQNLVERLAEANNMSHVSKNIYSFEGRLYIANNMGFNITDSYDHEAVISLLTQSLDKDKQRIATLKKECIYYTDDDPTISHLNKNILLKRREIKYHEERRRQCIA